MLSLYFCFSPYSAEQHKGGALPRVKHHPKLFEEREVAIWRERKKVRDCRNMGRKNRSNKYKTHQARCFPFFSFSLHFPPFDFSPKCWKPCQFDGSANTHIFKILTPTSDEHQQPAFSTSFSPGYTHTVEHIISNP